MLRFKPGKYKDEILLTDCPVSRFCKKIIVERHLLIEKRKGKLENSVFIALGKLIASFTQVPLRTEMGWAKWFLIPHTQHYIATIFPGKSSSHHDAYKKEWYELIKYCQDYTSEIHQCSK